MNESVDTGAARQTISRPGYWIYEWEEECSHFTPGAHWVGTEYLAVTCRMWIPDSVASDDDVERYVEQHSDDPDAWVNGDADGNDTTSRI